MRIHCVTLYGVINTASLGVEGMLFFSSSDFQKHIVNFIPVSLDIDVVVTAWEVWTFKVVINAGVKELDWIFKVESITDVFASMVLNTYVSEDAPWGVDGKLTENETGVDWSTVINWVDDVWVEVSVDFNLMVKGEMNVGAKVLIKYVDM